MKHEKVGYKVIFQNKQYLKMIVASIINRLGDSIDSIAFTWLVYQVTQSAAWSAIIFGVNRIPTIFLQPLAGAAIEKKNKRIVMVITDIIRGINVGFVATAYLFGFLDQWILLVSTILISCAEAFNRPAATALVPKLLDKEHYDFGLSLNSSASSIAELVGYGVAGVIIAVSSISTAIYIDMITFFLSALIIFAVKVKEEEYTKENANIMDYFSDLKSGFLYLKCKPLLRYFMIFAVFVNGILVPFNSLQAPLISEVLKTSELMLSVLSFAFSSGLVIGATIYPYIANQLTSRTIASISGYSIGAYYFSFVLVGNYIDTEIIKYIIITVVSFIIGILISFVSSFINVEFIKNTEINYLARGSAIMGAVSVASIPLFSFIVSILAKWFPTIVIFFIAGLIDVLGCIALCNKKNFIAFNDRNKLCEVEN